MNIDKIINGRCLTVYDYKLFAIAFIKEYDKKKKLYFIKIFGKTIYF